MRRWFPKFSRGRRLAFQSREAPPTLSLLLLLLRPSREAGGDEGDEGDEGDGGDRAVFASYGLCKNDGHVAMLTQRRSRELPSVTAKTPGDGAALATCDSLFCQR